VGCQGYSEQDDVFVFISNDLSLSATSVQHWTLWGICIYVFKTSCTWHQLLLFFKVAIFVQTFQCFGIFQTVQYLLKWNKDAAISTAKFVTKVFKNLVVM